MTMTGSTSVTSTLVVTYRWVRVSQRPNRVAGWLATAMEYLCSWSGDMAGCALLNRGPSSRLFKWATDASLPWRYAQLAN